jgi:hypothetical protein
MAWAIIDACQKERNKYKFILECCNLRILNVISIATTKKIATKKQEMRKSKHFSTRN